MGVIHAARALTPHGWRSNVRLTIESGHVAALETGVPAQPGDERHAILLPGMPNLHSHAFQRGMAGLAEVRGPQADSFWSWREVMYRFALLMTPDQIEAVASQLYVEMLEAGFSRVGEFHYLHHDRDGRAYGDIAEMAARIAAAADRTGIRLTLLPVFYAHSGFGGTPPTEAQRRFVCSIETYARLLARCRTLTKSLDGAIVGVAPHSLRAATQDELSAVVAMGQGGPIHIHVAEQTKEVEDCLAWSGQPPVDWLLDHASVDASWCLIHATHMSDGETRRMAAHGAIAGLCPITEANLGDGTFNAALFVEAGGRFGVGSDSNVLVGLSDELRQLEYSQRLRHRARNVMAVSGGSTGRALFDAALAGGAAALGAPGGGLAIGGPADGVSLDAARFPHAEGDEILDAWIFAGSLPCVDCVWVAGRKVVESGRHHARDAIGRKFGTVLSELRSL